jgi:hypothetical protein
MHEAALYTGEDPDRLSFLNAVRVVRRNLPHFVAIPKRKMSNFPLRPRNVSAAGPVNFALCIKVLK